MIQNSGGTVVWDISDEINNINYYGVLIEIL